ncbi:MAG TPA: 30S ribosomal protein S3 [Acidimicrobiia bacterium]|nr:30S ribosomal protein S3 [Acidimicrobiia bacterium]
MGQKTHPYSFRLGVATDWKSKWFSTKDYIEFVNEDWQIREWLRDELIRGAVSRIDIERTRDRLIVDIHTARPGVVIGRKGSEAERLREGLEKMTAGRVKLNINEVKDPDLDAALLARGIADQLENRIAFRRAMKRAVASALKAGAEGVRVECKGRLGGADMGRREWYREGRVPLHTLRADIDFGTATAHTTVGAIGVKVWVYRGEVVDSGPVSGERIAAEADLATGGPARRTTQKSLKSRAEEAAGVEAKPRLIEAGGGKRPVVETGEKEGGRRLIEAGGGRRPTAAEAQVQYESAQEEQSVAEAEAARAAQAAEEATAEETAGQVPAESKTASSAHADEVAEVGASPDGDDGVSDGTGAALPDGDEAVSDETATAGSAESKNEEE